jgi:hypothetical protein
MHKGKSCRIGLLAAFLVIFPMLMFSFSSSSKASPFTQPAMVERPAVLATCSVVSDQELSNIRGRYDTYYFGLDIIINLTGSGASFATRPHANMPPETIITQRGISFKDANVIYQAGIGRHNIFQNVGVMGDNKIVTGVVNLDILIPKSRLMGGQRGITLPKGSRMGLIY